MEEGNSRLWIEREQEAFIMEEKGFPYREFNDRVNRVAQALLAFGSRVGDMRGLDCSTVMKS